MERSVGKVTYGIGIDIIRPQTKCLVVIRPARFKIEGLHTHRIAGNTQFDTVEQRGVSGVVNVVSGVMQRSRTR